MHAVRAQCLGVKKQLILLMNCAGSVCAILHPDKKLVRAGHACDLRSSTVNTALADGSLAQPWTALTKAIRYVTSIFSQSKRTFNDPLIYALPEESQLCTQ